jgi:hypothetical protein
MEAIKHHGYALDYAKEQTPEICMVAVTQNKEALLHINKNICL